METPNQPTPRVPREPIREIDWLALVPWLLLLRVPGVAAFGWTLLVAALGAAVIGGVSSAEWQMPSSGQGAIELAARSLATPAVNAIYAATPLDLRGEVTAIGENDLVIGLVQLFGWAFLALVIADRGAMALTGKASRSLTASVTIAARRFLRVMILLVFVMAISYVLLFIWPAIGFHAVASTWWPVSIAVGAGWLLWLLATAALVVIGVGLVCGTPLALAAVVVDDADVFDALSRSSAYVYQRIARLAFYVVVAALAGVAAGTLLELFLGATMMVAKLGFPLMKGQPLPGSPTGHALAQWWEVVMVRGVRGFYASYFITASVAIYLLLRRDIDGQPIDEMVGVPDQVSSAA